MTPGKLLLLQALRENASSLISDVHYLILSFFEYPLVHEVDERLEVAAYSSYEESSDDTVVNELVIHLLEPLRIYSVVSPARPAYAVEIQLPRKEPSRNEVVYDSPCILHLFHGTRHGKIYASHISYSKQRRQNLRHLGHFTQVELRIFSERFSLLFKGKNSSTAS